MLLLSLLAVVGYAYGAVPTESPPVPINVSFTTQGQTITFQGLDYGIGKTFFGVPFGVPPVGDMRFKAAQQLTLSSGFYNATEAKPFCAQHKSSSVEDCLYLNMWLPQNVTADSKLPVYVYLFGGGYHSGGPEVPGDGAGLLTNIVNRGPVIAVLPNYRVGPFGFFSTRDDNVPGNMGLSDWIACLQWIQTYIRFFGGDPSKVTVGGASAGAISVSFLTLTRKADNLFRGIILESGTAFLPSAITYSDAALNSSKIIATETGCATAEQWDKQDPAENLKIVTCLRGKTQQEIMDADSKTPDYDTNKWSLVPDSDYLPGTLHQLALQRRPIPMLMGSMDLEFLFWMKNTILNGNISVFNRNYVDQDFKNNFALTLMGNPQLAYEGGKQLYIDKQTADDSMHDAWCRTHMDLYTELAFTGPVFLDAKYAAYTGSNVYVYIWEEYPIALDLILLDSTLRGAFHSLQLDYIYDMDIISNEPVDTGNDQYIVSQLTGKLWTNFIVTGNPTPASGGWDVGFTWTPLRANNNYLRINKKASVANGYNPRALFWVCNATVDGVPPPFC